MLYKDFHGEQISRLGFGLMRLPVTDEDQSHVDYDKVEELFLYACENGINYFDTAYPYHNGYSERTLGKILENNAGVRDKINIATPYLLINGDVAKEPGIARVAARQAPYNDTGYVALDPRLTPTAYLTRGQKVQLSTSVPSKPWLREYMAMGDNTLNSLDSRYWGPVHQFNVLGPASFTLWPFTWHWGAID